MVRGSGGRSEVEGFGLGPRWVEGFAGIVGCKKIEGRTEVVRRVGSGGGRWSSRWWTMGGSVGMGDSVMIGNIGNKGGRWSSQGQTLLGVVVRGGWRKVVWHEGWLSNVERRSMVVT